MIAYELKEFEKLLHYYDFLKNRLIELAEPIRPGIYYNLYLFNEDVFNFEIALHFLDKFLEYKNVLRPEQIFKAMIAKARINTKLGLYDEGIKRYEEILPRLMGEEYLDKRSIVLGRMLYNIPLTKGYDKNKVLVIINELVEQFSELV